VDVLLRGYDVQALTEVHQFLLHLLPVTKKIYDFRDVLVNVVDVVPDAGFHQ
jgi:hypothetical protein